MQVLKLLAPMRHGVPLQRTFCSLLLPVPGAGTVLPGEVSGHPPPFMVMKARRAKHGAFPVIRVIMRVLWLWYKDMNHGSRALKGSAPV